MEIKDGVVHGLTILAFPLQIVAWVFFGNVLELLVPIILSIFVHALYYIRVIVRGEKQYKKLFFFYEVIVAAAMWITFIVKLFGYFPEFWIFIVPMFVQVGACAGLYIQHRQEDSEDVTIDVIDEKENERFKRGFMNAVGIFAFLTQLVFYGWIFANGYGFISVLMVIFFIASLIAHFLYFHNVIWRAQTQYKGLFFYFEVAVALSQCVLITTNARCGYGFGYGYGGLRDEDIWLAVLPLLIQVITCTYLYVQTDKSETVEGQQGPFKRVNMPREFTAFPVQSKTNDYEIL